MLDESPEARETEAKMNYRDVRMQSFCAAEESGQDHRGLPSGRRVCK